VLSQGDVSCSLRIWRRATFSGVFGVEESAAAVERWSRDFRVVKDPTSGTIEMRGTSFASAETSVPPWPRALGHGCSRHFFF